MTHPPPPGHGPAWPTSPNLKIIDVGAMSLGEGIEDYARLMQAAPCEVLGFEPLIDEPVTGTGNDDLLGEGKQDGE